MDPDSGSQPPKTISPVWKGREHVTACLFDFKACYLPPEPDHYLDLLDP